MHSSPVAGPDGTVYMTSDDGHVYAFTSTGKSLWNKSNRSETLMYLQLGSLKWSYELSNSVLASPAVGPEGMVYVGASDFYLYAFNSTGARSVYITISFVHKYSVTIRIYNVALSDPWHNYIVSRHWIKWQGLRRLSWWLFLCVWLFW